jgi:hypothetical protein
MLKLSICMSPVHGLQSVVLSHFGPSDRPHSSNTLLLQSKGTTPQQHMESHPMTSNRVDPV